MLNSLKLILENESSDEPVKVGQFKKTGKMSLVSADDQIDSYLINLQFGAVQIQKEEDQEIDNNLLNVKNNVGKDKDVVLQYDNSLMANFY